MTEAEDYRKKLEEVARFPDMNPGPVLRLDFKGCVLLSNTAAQNLFGQDLHGKNWKTICSNVTKDLWKQILLSKEVFPVESSVGEKCFIFTHRTDLKTNLVFVFGSDITSNKQNEKKLEEQKAIIEEVARFPHMNPGPVLRMDFKGNILLTNIAAQKLFGEDLTGKNWRDKCQDITDEMWTQFTSSEAVFPIETQIQEKVFMLNHRSDLQSRHLFVFGTDITLQRLAERQLYQSERMATLGTLAAGIAHELNNPAAAASSAAIQLKDLIINSEQWRNKMLLHNLNDTESELISELLSRAVDSSLHKVKMSLRELTEKENEAEDWLIENNTEGASEYAASIVSLGYSLDQLREFLTRFNKEFFFTALIWAAHQFQINSLLIELNEAAGRISEIVSAMKSYSFLDKAPVQEVDVHEGINNTLIILRNKLTPDININLQYGSIPKITAYGSELNQVWTNILDNGISALQGKGEITIRTMMENNFVVVEIEDNGPGIPQEIQSRIFDPFFTTKEPGKGTGLGLSASYGIITEKHNGSIRLESQLGKTIFIISLPIGGSDKKRDISN